MTMAKDPTEFPQYNITAAWTFSEDGLVWPRYNYAFTIDSIMVTVQASAEAPPYPVFDVKYEDIRKMLTLADEVQELKQMVADLIKMVEALKDE